MHNRAQQKPAFTREPVRIPCAEVWRGVRSRPTWRIFCYSAEEPPLRRGLVLVDAVNGSVVECLVEQNPEAEVTTPETSGE